MLGETLGETPRLQPGGAPLFITDAGLETHLVFHDGWDLPEFAAFPLLLSSSGRTSLRDYYLGCLAVAEHSGLGFVLPTPTWRASQSWGDKLGFTATELGSLNRQAVLFVRELGRSCSARLQKMLIVSGQIGPFDSGSNASATVSVGQAERYHEPQMAHLLEAGVNQIEALTLSHTDEAIAITRVADRLGVPVVISFTVAKNGRLTGGTSLAEAIHTVDGACSSAPAFYMINCAHADHVSAAIEHDISPTTLRRIGGLRTNASRCGYVELDHCTPLLAGDPTEFGLLHEELLQRLPALRVLGGCCGTDARHIEALAKTIKQRAFKLCNSSLQ